MGKVFLPSPRYLGLEDPDPDVQTCPMAVGLKPIHNHNLRAYLRKTVSQKANLTNISTFYNYFNQLQNISEFSAGELFCDWLKLLLKGRKLHHVGFLADWRTRVRRSRHLRWKLVGFTVYTPFSKLDGFVPSSNKWPTKLSVFTVRPIFLDFRINVKVAYLFLDFFPNIVSLCVCP